MTIDADALDAQSIAIVGMAGRFPGADDVDQLWRLLREGREARRTLTDDELRAAGVDEALIAHSDYVKAEMTAPDGAEFDAALFGLTASQAASIDPQQRLFLECSWEALENAGYGREARTPQVGVFAGSGTSFHLYTMLASRGREGMDLFQSIIDADKDFMASRVSYKLDLTGPSIGVQTACSTSLVAVHLAVQSLLSFECDMALAGGASLSPQPGTGYLYVRGGITAADGHCRSYDAEATGMTMGGGAAVVALKRLNDAVADGDNIYAVIRSTAVNNDGANKVGFTAPGLRAQTQLIATTWALAGVEPEEIGLVEGHGTGTALGDMVELTALHDVFGNTATRRTCALGSIKSNLGHMDTASGVTGLIKAALCLRHNTLVPSLHFHRANDALAQPGSPFFVPTGTMPWVVPPGGRRLAGVSSMGIGGTNAHVLLEEAPPRIRRPVSGAHIFPVSAADPAALSGMARLLADVGRSRTEDLADIAYTLQIGRSALAHRTAIVAASHSELARGMDGAHVAATLAAAGRTAVHFPARADNLAGMAGGIYREDAAFRDDLDRCARVLGRAVGGDVREVLCFGDLGGAGDTATLFALEFCLARLWLRWGLAVDLFLGSGVGELAAACVADAIPLDDAALMIGSAADAALPASRAGGRAAPRVPIYRFDQGWLGEGHEAERRTRDLAVLASNGAPLYGRLLELLPQRRRAMHAGAAVRSSPDGMPFDRATLLGVLADMWCVGATIDWRALHGDDPPRRVALPAYPFQRQRCRPETRSALAATPSPAPPAGTPGRQPPTQWLYAPACVAAANPAPPGSLGGKSFLVFAASGFADRLIDRLRRLGARVIAVRPGTGYSVVDDDIAVGPCVDDYDRLIDEIMPTTTIDGVFQCWDAPDARPRPATAAHLAVLGFMQAWQARQPDAAKVLLAVTHGLHDVVGESGARPAAAMLASLCMVISQEQGEARCSVVDLPDVDPARPDEHHVDWLIAELVRPTREMVAVYRGRQRLTASYQPIALGDDAPEIRPMRRGGVYLLVGGLGGIGLALALHLGRTYRARIAIMSRTVLPPRGEWRSVAADEGHPHRATIASLVAIEDAGGVVLTVAADVASERELADALASVERALGPVNGVYHLATAQGRSVQRPWTEITRDDLEDQLRPKLDGFRALTAAFAGRALDFGVAFSSKAAILGGFGFAAYATANAALDRAVAGEIAVPPRWLGINWGGWRVASPATGGVGPLEPAGVGLNLDDPDALAPDEGFRMLDVIVTRATVPQLVVSPTPLDERLATWTRHRLSRAGVPAGTRLTFALAEDDDTLRTRVADLLRDALAVEHIADRDTFRDLGGDSLIALRVRFLAQKTFGTVLPPEVLTEGPVLPAMVAYLSGLASSATQPAVAGRGVAI